MFLWKEFLLLSPMNSLLLVALSLLIFALSRTGRGRKLPPGPWALPLLGNLFQINVSAPHKSLIKLSETYGPVFTVWFGRQRAVIFCGYEAVRDALITRGEDFSDRSLIPFFDRVSRGYGVLASSGERWRILRRFTLSTLRDFGMGKRSIEERIQEEAQSMLAVIREKKGKPFDPAFVLRCAVSNIICSVTFGDRFEYGDKRFLHLMGLIAENAYLLSSPWGQVYNSFPTIMQWMPGPHNKLFRNTEDLRSFLKDMVRSHKESFQRNHSRDFIDSFLNKMEDDREQDPKTEFHDENLEISILNLFLAGTETTSTTLRYGLLFLMKYPKIQERVQEEIDQVIGQNRCPAIEDRAKMPYTDAVIHEMQRFIDLVPLNLPHQTTRDIEYRGYFLAKGTFVMPVLSSVLKSPTQWETPETFNPQHFLDADGRFKKRDGFMPFSAGKRICAGEGLARMELFLFLTSMLQNFTFRSQQPPALLDITPAVSGFLVVPRAYQCQALAR